jgi:hypothetical protein
MSEMMSQTKKMNSKNRISRVSFPADSDFDEQQQRKSKTCNLAR